MRISPKQLLQGLLYTAPVLLLALASCGGGRGGGSSATLASAYTLSVNVNGVSGASAPLVLRNGGDNLSFTATGTLGFGHQVLSGSTYNISAASQPQPTATTNQLCTFTNGSTSLIGIMPAGALNVNVGCVNAYTISTNITGLNSNGLVLQNNGADNYQAASGVPGFIFSTPVAASGGYTVTILKQPLNPATNCVVTNNIGSHIQSNITGASAVTVTCATASSRPEDPYVYAANSGSSSNAYAFKSLSGVLSGQTMVTQGSGRAAIAAVGGKFVLIASGTSAGSVASYLIGTGGALSKVNEVATGNTPFAIAVHPSGKFAYVVNEVSNSISAYSIATNGALASIDANGTTTANDPTIRAGDIPVAIAIDPAGAYAYVVNANSGSTNVCGNTVDGCITVFAIDANGALTPTPAQSGGAGNSIITGIGPSSIAIDPSGKYAYVTNLNDTIVSQYNIGVNGTLSGSSFSIITGTGSSSIAISPNGNFAYVTFPSTNTVTEYSLSSSNGALSSITNTIMTTPGSQPNSVSIDSSGNYAYIANNGTNKVSAYSIVSGALTTYKGDFIAGTGPVAVITAP